MPIRHYAQRQHIIQSLDTLLYQLFTLSFFLSPTVWPLICRSATQFQFSRPRDLDPKRSLRFWFFLILLFNASSIWSHAAEGAVVGRAVVLDFVGMAHIPTKLQLLLLDFLIVVLQMALTTIAYETSYVMASPDDTPDLLLPSTPNTSSYTLLSTAEEDTSDIAGPSTPSTPTTTPDCSKPPQADESPYVIELRLSAIIDRIRQPAPPPPETENGLPLPNMTPATLSEFPTNLQRLARMRRAMRNARRVQGQANEERAGETPGRVPGGLGDDDGG